MVEENRIKDEKLINLDKSLEELIHKSPYRDYLFGERFIKYGGYAPNTFSLSKTINFFAKRYVKPLSQVVDIKSVSLCDCACGYGWFTFAFLLLGGGANSGRAVATMDIDPSRGKIVKDFAELLDLGDRVEFTPGELSSLPFKNKEFKVFACIETLEHVPHNLRHKALKEIGRVSEYQLITTPNKLWPIDYHDRQMPFKHWFDGRFLTQFEIVKEMNAELLTNVYCFDSWEELESIYPLYWPYPGQVINLNKRRLLPFKMISLFSRKKSVQYILPQIQGIYRRRR